VKNVTAETKDLETQWQAAWKLVGERILKLPKWMQTILLDDINTAIGNRVTVMELILHAQTNS
jgi:hypothetical protein